MERISSSVWRPDVVSRPAEIVALRGVRRVVREPRHSVGFEGRHNGRAQPVALGHGAVRRPEDDRAAFEARMRRDHRKSICNRPAHAPGAIRPNKA